MFETSRIADDGTVTIPEAFREQYDLDPGDEVRWIDGDDGIRLEKRTESEARGMLVPEDLDDEARREVAEELVRRLLARRDRYR